MRGNHDNVLLQPTGSLLQKVKGHLAQLTNGLGMPHFLGNE